MYTSVFSHRPGFPATVHTAPPDIRAYDAARLMAWRKVGMVLVVKHDRPIGLVTDRDLATRVLANGLMARSVRVSRVMTAPVVTMTMAEADEQILGRMLNSRIRQIPLVDAAGHLIGLAAADLSSDCAGMCVTRSTVLSPMVKRKRLRRMAFRFKQGVIAHLRLIEVTVALAALGGAVLFLAAGYWTPWASARIASSARSVPEAERPGFDRPTESAKWQGPESGVRPSATK